ncbi:MAG: HAMP domain-containing protein [Deltaproteobacteria bacterium]|nr:HAMP domain-containing protein [Deltaproteobacteria bacterium]
MKKNIKLIWHIYPSYLILTLLVLAAVIWFTAFSWRIFFLERTEANLNARAQLLESMFINSIQSPDIKTIDRLCKEIAGSSETRITIILKNGRVIGDSTEDPAAMDNHIGRPEVQKALQGEIGSSIRYSGTLRRKMMYIARPLIINREIKSVLRISIPIASIDTGLRSMHYRIIMGGILIAVIVSLISLFIAHSISRPIEEMRKGAERFACGDLDHRLYLPETLELAGLADALNRMAEQIKERMASVINQRNEFKAVLASMTEGIIALDMGDVIIGINNAAEKIFDLKQSAAKGRYLHEIIRNREMHLLISKSALFDRPCENDILVSDVSEKIVHTNCAPLFNSDHKRIGSLIVLQDVTHVRHLENIRKDFVANVSHEIRTPLTAIKGFVETILYNHDHDRAETEKFLGIISKHVNRLEAITEDLLSLATIEKKGAGNEPGNKLRLENSKIKDIIETALQVVEDRAKKKSIDFDISCSDDIVAETDIPLLEQALVNLIDNAVKYSPEGEKILVWADRQEKGILIHVKDNGPGIPKKHLPRLFERFYRVDKARSRSLGGTGLGLAIVKHIIQAHGGSVTADSAPGKGSTFTIHLPF